MASILSAGTSSGTALNLSGDTSGILQLASNNGTVGLTMDTSQNIGIGTTSPSSYGKLAVVGAAANTLSAVVDTTGYALFRATNTSGQSYVGVDSSTGTLTGTAYATTLWGQNAYPTVFATNNAERMRIDSSGNLLVGVTSTFTSIVQGIQAQAVGGASLALNRTTNTGAVARFFYAGTEVGNISVTGSATTFNSTSDYRLKENVAPMTDALNKVSLLKPVTYTWKADGSAGQGFIAHELQAIIPDAVTGEKDAIDKNGNPEYQSIDPRNIVATLTAAIQEQQALITTLQTQVAALQAKVGA